MSEAAASPQRYPCAQCGAQLEFKPGTTSLQCPYCGHVTPIAPPKEGVQELDLAAWTDKAHLNYEFEKVEVVKCQSCAAEFSVGPDQATAMCPFCGSRVLSRVEPESRIAPNGVLPFTITDARARECLGAWLGSRFWAPNDLKRLALKEGRLRGMYIPFWTFDSFTETDYTGMRGEYYWVTVSYSTMENGRSVTRTRQERRTRWYPAAGHVSVPFDDVLVQASTAIPREISERLVDWNLSQVTGYSTDFLVGFQAMRYDIDLANGLMIGRDRMQPGIDMAIRGDIGGDEQQILTKSTDYLNNTFKLLLLPIWVGGYQYRQRPYRFVVNGQTGEMQGEAPVSFWKVALAVLLGLIVLGVIIYFVQQNQGHGSTMNVSMPE